MATLENIRKRSGLLIVVIGLALGAFILTDFLSNGSSMFSDDPNIVGSVDGRSITIADFGRELDLLRNSDPQYQQQPQSMLVNTVWTDWIRTQILGEKYDELGFAITAKELKAKIIQNPNISGNQAFLGANGQFDVNKFDAALRNLRETSAENPEGWNQWILFEDAIKEQALTFKYNDAVEAGLYTPKALAQYKHRNTSVGSDVAFVMFPYTSVADEEVEVTEADYKAYYEEHKHEFAQDFETRDIAYVNFAIEPSDLDRQEVREDVEKLIESQIVYNNTTGQNDTILGFRDTKDDSIFVALNSTQPYRPGFWRTGDLSSNIDSIIFASEEGFIYGPYEEQGGFKVTKLQEVRYLPDSVKARHILFAYQTERNPQAPMNRAQAKALADSIFEIVKADRSQFLAMNEEYSEDPTAKAEGGDLGWFGPKAMVPTFSNYSFENEVGDLGLVESPFGFHIIEIEDQKGSAKAVRVATLYKEVIVTRRTETAIYEAAAKFAANASQPGVSFDSIATAQGYQARQSPDIQEAAGDIIGLGAARPIVKWAFGAEAPVSEGDVNLISNDGRAYVVAMLTGVNPEGYKSLERVREQIRPMVINRVKAEQVLMARAKSALEGQTAMSAVAETSGNDMKIQRVTLGVGALPGIGQEGKVVGFMSGTPVGELRGPVAGNKGVFVWQPNAISDFTQKPDYTADAQNQTKLLRQRVNSQLFPAMVNEYDIVDNRIRFY